MDNKQINEKQSIELIEDMINTAKREQTRDPWFYYVLWGTVLILYFLLMYIAIVMQASWQPWTANLFLIGGVLSIWYSRKHKEEEKSRSWFDRLYMYVWLSVGISLGIAWGFVARIGIDNILPLNLMIYASASLVIGGVTKFYPSLVGSIICFICVVVAFNVSFAYQNIVCAFAVLCVHLVPGLIMRQYNKLEKYVQ